MKQSRYAATRRGVLRAAAMAAVALCVAAAAVSAQRDVLDPAARRLLDPIHRSELLPLARPLPGMPQPDVPLAASYSVYRDAGVIMVGLIVSGADAASLAQLRALGADVGAVIGDIATVRVPLDRLEELEALPIARAEAARMLTAVHDSSMRAIRADAVRQHTGGTWLGRTGAGVIVGIIDTGLDLAHADFRDDAGRTRVLGAWDQMLGGRAPTGFGYGFHCTREAVQQAIDTNSTGPCPLRDRVGHGTHVLGTAAGNGGSQPAAREYAGVAPETDLLVVRAGEGLFAEDRVLDALAWLRQEAERQGRPAVVNLSFGHQLGPHDGTLLFERAIDALAGPGFIIVASAGNNGANGTAGPESPRRLIHARVTPAAGTTTAIEFEIAPYAPGTGSCISNAIAFSGWYTAHDRVHLTVLRPNGSSVAAASGDAAVQASNSEGRILLENAIRRPTGDATAEAYIQIDGCGGSGPPAPGRWRILLRAEPVGVASGTPIDIYMHTVQFAGGGTAYGTTGFDNRFTVGAPGTARRVITVGAFATRGCWPDRTGVSRCYDQRETIGDLARFSSAGPTRDGRRKPEIAAPGIGIISALSRHASPPATRVADGGAHWTLEGTSMAAPHVAGAIALLLQELPTLTPEQARDILAATAHADVFTGRTYDSAGEPRDWWGAGKLDVAAAFAAVAPVTAVASIDATPAADTIVQNATRQLIALARNAAGDVVFAPVAWRSLTPDVATVDFAGRIRALQPGVAAVVASAGMAADTVQIVVEPPAVLVVTGTALAGEEPRIGARDAILPLLSLRLHADGREAIRVQTIGLEMSGADVDTRILLVRGPFTGGVLDTTALIASVRTLLGTAARALTINIDSLTVAARAERDVSVLIRLTGTAPHGGAFSARLLPDGWRTRNIESGATDRVTQAHTIATTAATTLLRADEPFTLSENPVRSGSVHMHFAEAPTEAAVYTVAGARVVDLTQRLSGTSVTWDLTNDQGSAIAPGVYLLVVRTAGQLVREKIMVLRRPAGRLP